MTRSSSQTRCLPPGVAAVVAAVLAGALVPLGASGAAAQAVSPSPSASPSQDTTAPTFSVRPSLRVPVEGALTVLFSEPVTGVDAGSVTVERAPATVGASADGRSALVRPLSRLLPGATYRVGVSPAVRDLAGNPVAPARVTFAVDPIVDDRSPAMGYGGRWQRLASTNAVAGTFSRSVPLPTRRTAATVALFGRGAEVRGCVGPANGVIELWADGVRRTRIDTYRSFSGCGVLLTRVPLSVTGAAHRVQVRGVGAKNVRSRGTAVSVDAVIAVR